MHELLSFFVVTNYSIRRNENAQLEFFSLLTFFHNLDNLCVKHNKQTENFQNRVS